MAASGGVGRGVLRPGFGRSPPFIMIGLLIITGICAFNYWNLSAQYNDLVKEITELQEHVQIVTLKRETAEKHVDALQQRLSEAGDHLGEVKVELEKKLKEEKRQEEEIRNLRNELKVFSPLFQYSYVGVAGRSLSELLSFTPPFFAG